MKRPTARRWASVLALAASAVAPPLAAEESARGEPTLNVTSTTLAGWHTDLDYGALFERFNATAGLGAFQLGLRTDTATFVRPPSAVRDRYTLEKVWLGFASRSVELVVGDAYVAFGRGLALSLRKVDELGVDSTLRGAKLLVHDDKFGATLVAGATNINNVDEASGKSIDDPRDLIVGARVEGTPGATTLGAHVTAVAFRQSLGLVPTDEYHDRFIQVGPTLDAPRLTPWLGLYAEGVAQLRRTEAEGTAPWAYGGYAAATGYFGAVTVLAEGKLYGDLEPIKPRVERPEFGAVAYNNLPTAERLLQILENPQRRIAGGRVRADWKVTSALTSYANFALFWDRQGYANPVEVGQVRPGMIQDPYVGIELRPVDGRSWVLASVGWRSVFLEGSGVIVRQDSHVELDAAQELAKAWNVTLHVIHEERKKYESAILDRRFREGTVLAGIRRSPWGSLGLGYDYTTDPIQPKHHYWNANAEWNITSSSSLRLFAGGTRGGLRCMSGVCRVFPPFEGVKLSATLRF